MTICSKLHGRMNVPEETYSTNGSSGAAGSMPTSCFARAHGAGHLRVQSQHFRSHESTPRVVSTRLWTYLGEPHCCSIPRGVMRFVGLLARLSWEESGRNVARGETLQKMW